ncbi:MAG: hypothetical protein ACRD4R_07560 [Candidatus Acidiferrales bacterium]
MVRGFTMLRMLDVKIDYRDGMVWFGYDAKRWGASPALRNPTVYKGATVSNTELEPKTSVLEFGFMEAC